LPLYPPAGQPYLISFMRESDDLPTVASKNLEQFRSYFSEREALHTELQALNDRKDPIITFAFESSSHSFPLLPGPELAVLFTDVCSRGTPDRQKRNVKALQESMIATAHCCDLLAQHPVGCLPTVITRADGFTCGLANLLHFIITTRPWKFRTLWTRAHLLRVECSYDSPAFCAWESSGITMRRLPETESIIVEVESRALGAAIMRHWRCKRDEEFFVDAFFKPLLELLGSRQNYKDQALPKGRSSNSSTADSSDCVDLRWKFRDALMERLDTMMP
jgi:hypothetical protein